MSNPILNDNFTRAQEGLLASEPMTINGAITKTGILLALVVLSAAYTWSLCAQGFTDKAYMLMWAGLIGGTIAAFAGIFTVRSSLSKGEVPSAITWLAPVYALFEGLFLGAVSANYQALYEGIVTNAILATFTVMFVMLGLYRARLIRATQRFRSSIILATASVAVIYLIQIVASLFGRGIPQIFTASPIGIGFSLVVIVVAAFNFILDFDFIERAAQNMLPKSTEWYGAMGLMLTLVWLYLEMLRLFAKLNRR